jgi:hypothetical protein
MRSSMILKLKNICIVVVIFFAADAVGFVVFCDVVCIAVVVVIFTFVVVIAFVVVFTSFVVIVVDRPTPVLTGLCLY